MCAGMGGCRESIVSTTTFSFSYRPPQKLCVVARDVARDLALQYRFDADFKKLSGFVKNNDIGKWVVVRSTTQVSLQNHKTLVPRENSVPHHLILTHPLRSFAFILSHALLSHHLMRRKRERGGGEGMS